MRFEWDPRKDLANFEKHGVRFQEAMSGLGDPLAATIYDPDHSEEEDRFLTIGRSEVDRLLVVAHTDQGSSIRIISARPATARERFQYESAF